MIESKVNLYLKVLKKLKSDFHIIQSLVTFCSISDIISLSEIKNSKDKIIFHYQGLLHKGRGIKQMIQLLPIFKNAHAVIIGKGHYKDELINYGSDE